MKKFIIPSVISLVIILAIVFKLFSNKRKIDEAKEPVDRTEIPVSVKVTKAEKKALDINVHYPATTKPYEDAKVYSQSSGIIDKLNIELGNTVSEGQTLGKLDTRLLEINLKDAEIALEKASDDYERAKDLYENEAGVKVDMLNAKTSYDKALNQVKLIGQQIENAQIIAPIKGIISSHSVKEGEFINPGTPIASINNVFLLKATVYVFQETVYQLELGQKAIITTPVFDQEQFTGEIIFISPVADANHNYQVDLLVHQKDNIHLKGGTDVQVSFNTMMRKDVLQIPKSALMVDADEPYVFVIDNETAVSKTVKTGVTRKDQVEVISGISVGDVVVTNGQINLRDGSKVSIIKQ